MGSIIHRLSERRQSKSLRGSAWVLVFAGLWAAPTLASAQVIEIGAGGAVTIHDRPSVFQGGVVEPIPAPRTIARMSARSSSALVDAADDAGLSPELVEAVGWRESRLRPGVVSPAGAIGEMQLMPGTARALGVNPYDSRENYQGGATYLSNMLRRYDGDLVRALAAYNAGPGAVDRYGGVPPYKETREYVAAIMDRLSARAALQGESEPRK